MAETFTAKQVATRIGTDAKTLRKFLRSSSSPYQAVGQGGRYEFPKSDLGRIKKAFEAWEKGKRPSTVPAKPAPKGPTPLPGDLPGEDVDDDSPRRTRERKIRVKINEGPEVVMEADDEPTQDELDRIEQELKGHFPDEDFELEID